MTPLFLGGGESGREGVENTIFSCGKGLVNFVLLVVEIWVMVVLVGFGRGGVKR
jgi:hypothetical protein